MLQKSFRTELLRSSRAAVESKALHSILKEHFPEEIVKFGESMSFHTTFKTGGDCDAMIIPDNVDDIRHLVQLCNNENIPLTVIGNGSNLLVRDGGIRGVVLKIFDNFCYTTINDNTITSQAGALLSSMAYKAMNKSLMGLEFASGIPGTVGGGVVMNAGAYGGELKDILSYSVYIDKKGDIVRVGKDDHGFGYRKSMFSNGENILIESAFILKRGNRTDIKRRMADLNRRRREKQPLTIPNAGSVFKRPEGYYAGALIQESGLMGARFGGACVSNKHAGFIVNDKNGTSEDVELLMEYIKKTVYNKTGVELKPEIKIIGEMKR
ncbi:MAG: UDP-N-acetylmuramate dehydrogenase [Clostridiales bacterium]|nr:UDP-N-acetylmuramate dehydrogenase [Clostridiales bacterium]